MGLYVGYVVYYGWWGTPVGFIEYIRYLCLGPPGPLRARSSPGEARRGPERAVPERPGKPGETRRGPGNTRINARKDARIAPQPKPG